MKIRCRFYECEHSGDLARYEEDVIAAGARVLDKQCDRDADVGFITAEVADVHAFKLKLAETPSGDFLSGLSIVK